MPKTIYEGKAHHVSKSQYGLPFEQLPVGDMTPESMINEQTRIGKQEIQDKYALQWKEVNRSRRFIGAGKSKRMLREIDAKAKQEMLQFNQQAQQQMVQLQNINRLVEVGGLTETQGAKTKAGMVYGRDVANRMYPEPEKGRSIPQQFGELDLYKRRIENVLAQFRRKKERIPSIWLGKKKEGVRPGKVQIYDVDAGKPEVNEKTGKTEYWRDASPEEIQIRNMYSGMLEGAKKDIGELFGTPDIRRRVVQPGTKGGTFDDKIAESVKPRQTPTAKPKTIRQRNTRTGEERISYDGGKTWQTSG